MSLDLVPSPKPELGGAPQVHPVSWLLILRKIVHARGQMVSRCEKIVNSKIGQNVIFIGARIDAFLPNMPITLLSWILISKPAQGLG